MKADRNYIERVEHPCNTPLKTLSLLRCHYANQTNTIESLDLLPSAYIYRVKKQGTD